MVLFDEPRNWVRLRCIGMVGIGVIGLKLAPGR
jgi:multidrug transporter EmrE-like cation transporter